MRLARLWRVILCALVLTLTGCLSSDAPAPAADEVEQPSDSIATPEAGLAPEADLAPASRTAPQSAERVADSLLVSVEQLAVVRDANDAFLHLRQGPSSQHESLAQMVNGSSAQIVECIKGEPGARWCLVIFKGTFGWAFERGLDYEGNPNSPLQGPDFATAVVSDPDGWANLRLAATADSGIRTRLDSGTRVEIIECIPTDAGSRWCEIITYKRNLGNIIGWIAESRLKLD